MKKIRKAMGILLSVVMCMALAAPVFAEGKSEIRIYDVNMEYLGSVFSEEELQYYLKNLPQPCGEAGCGSDPRQVHGSKTYETYFGTDYDYEANRPLILYAIRCSWCNEIMKIVARPND